MTDQASKRILQEYTSGEAWITYGSFEGKWAEQVRAVTEEEFKDVRKSTWVYGHPRSFKVGLTKFLYSAFKNEVQSAEIWSFQKNCLRKKKYYVFKRSATIYEFSSSNTTNF